MKKLSVITVTYNAEKTLERTLRSVQEQTYPHLEHVIVDGASHDGTIHLINTYARDNVKWVSEPDRGLYDAMNKGITMASGDYLCFLNAGDTFYDAETVQKMMFCCETENSNKQPSTDNTSPDILYGETAIVDNDGNFLHMRRLKAPKTLTWKSFKQGMLVCHQAFIVKRSLAEPYDLSYRFSSDFDWCVRMMKKSRTIQNTRLILINYLNEGITTENHKASLRERYQIMVKYYGQLSTFLHHIWFIFRAVLK